MKKILNLSLNVLSKAVSIVVLSVVSMATGTISLWGSYEPEMPAVLKPADREESE